MTVETLEKNISIEQIVDWVKENSLLELTQIYAKLEFFWRVIFSFSSLFTFEFSQGNGDRDFHFFVLGMSQTNYFT
jgi:hypothetical protein